MKKEKKKKKMKKKKEKKKKKKGIFIRKMKIDSSSFVLLNFKFTKLYFNFQV